MARPAEYDILFESVPIGPKTMRNRFYFTPHASGYGNTSPGAQAYYRAMRAEGGWAVVNTEAVSIAPEFDFSGKHPASRIWDDGDAANWALMTAKAHEHGALAGIELHAGGAFLTGVTSRLPARHLHDRREAGAWLGAVVTMDKRDIREIQQMYVDAAVRAERAGFDIINVHGAEVAAFPVLFLMTLHNDRTDEYGGSLQNRSRFWIETLEMVRGAVGDSCAVTARFCVDSLHNGPGGIAVDDEGVGFIELADHLVDFWDLQVGGETMEMWMKDVGPARFYPQNFQGEWVARVRPHTSKPIVGVGRLTDPDSMVGVIRSGQLDIIGGARPGIADPFLPRKIEEGRIEDIRECIGCNACVSRETLPATLICTQNPTTGEEYRRRWHPEHYSRATNADRTVLVVGAGPAGLECGMVLGERGMSSVHIVESTDRIGGHVNQLATIRGMEEWRKVIDWRRTRIDKLPNVTVVTGRPLSAADVLDYGADIVVIATGSRWAADGIQGATHRPIPGAEHPSVVNPGDLLEVAELPDGDRVVVYDTDGYFMGVSLAERFARAGRDVTLVTPMLEAAPYMRLTGERVGMRPLLERLGVTIVDEHIVTSIRGDSVEIASVYAPENVRLLDSDLTVLVTQRHADDRLYKELEADPAALEAAGIEALYRIGDCLAPRMLAADAIFDAHRLAREIDAADPAVALPFIRERRVLGWTEDDYEGMLR
jgi:dimethylamine/trimethylamine dehydrogenase